MNYSSKEYLGDRPYVRSEEYLDDLLSYILLCLRSYISNNFGSQKDDTAIEKLQLPGYQEVLKELDIKLNHRNIDDDQELSDWYDIIQSRREVSESMGKVYPIDEMIRKAGLGEFGLIVLPVVLLGVLDRSYKKVFELTGSAKDSGYPTLELCARLYLKEAFTPYKMKQLIDDHASGLQLLFPGLAKSDNLMYCQLECDDRLTDLIIGKNRFLTAGVTIIEYDDNIAPLYHREEELKQLMSFSGEAELPLFLICGNKGAGKKHLILHYSRSYPATVFYDIRNNTMNETSDINLILLQLRYAARECLIKTLPFAVTGLEQLKEGELQRLTDFLKSEIKTQVPIIFLCMEQEHYQTGAEGIYIIELKDFTELQRFELWKYYTEDYVLEDKPDLYQLANTFIITPGQIIGAIRQAALLSGGRNKPIKPKLLYQACYSQLDHKLSEKTSRVNANFTWEDLKMPPSDKEILRDICNCVKNKHIVMNEWNFSKIIPYGSGLTVMFAGPPGTGKTMAAQVIAGELGMELYKIDVSQVFDKYVGETEKNIKQIFDQAKRSNSILFFDEADAIFNKRIEAASSNDRFANIESSLLLQCVEEYSGISILATNNFNSIDTAFIRRFKFYVLFREPDEAVRYEIWKSIIPKEAPLSRDVDLKLLAKQFEFTGAVIKNVIISSAYLAAEKKEPISMIDILLSIKREMFKNNLILTKEKLGSLGYLFEDIK